MPLKSVKHVACYLSGSANSAVAALLLRKKGYYLTGVFLENRFQSQHDVEKQRHRAQKTAEALQMPLHQVALGSPQWDDFVSLILGEYAKKRIPSVDVLFTKAILFGRLFEKVLGSTGADFVTSGHFARTSVGEHIDKWTKLQGSRLLKPLDLQQDDSYILSQLPQSCLQKLYFPLGEIAKEVIPKIVESTELNSLYDDLLQNTDLPLVQEDQLMNVLEKDISNTKGNIVQLLSGRIITHHEGLHLWPVGKQFTHNGESFCVASRDENTNDVQVVDKPDHPALFSSTFFTSLAHWSHETPYNFFEKHTMDSSFRFDACQPLIQGALTVGAHNEWCGNDHIIVSSPHPVRCVQPGHITAFYQGDECIGSATIIKPGPSEYVMNYSKYKNSKPDSPRNKTVKRFLNNIFPKS